MFLQDCQNIEAVRANIDQIDRQIVRLLAERSDYVEQAARFKKTTDDVKAPARVEAVIGKVRGLAVEEGINPDIVERVYQVMIECFINQEMKHYQAGTANKINQVISRAELADLEEILALQKLAYLSEAELCNDYNIPPLRQTLVELQQEAGSSIILKAVRDNKIIGSVRAYQKDSACYIGRLIVHPDYQNQGLGKQLMAEIERCFAGCRYELFTGVKSVKNLAFYEKLGYRRFKTERIGAELELVYLEKSK